MIVLKATQDKVLAVLQSVSGIVERRHTLPILANVIARRGGTSISDGFPESGGGGASAAITVIGVDADAAGADATGAGPDVAASDDDEGGEGDGDPDRQTRKALRTRNPKVGADQRSSSTNKRRDGAVNQMTSTPRADAQPNATTSAGALPSPQNPDIALWRLPTVLAHVPVSRSHWWAGVAEGRYPAPVKLSKRCVAWRSADIRALIASF